MLSCVVRASGMLSSLFVHACGCVCSRACIAARARAHAWLRVRVRARGRVRVCQHVAWLRALVSARDHDRTHATRERAPCAHECYLHMSGTHADVMRAPHALYSNAPARWLWHARRRRVELLHVCSCGGAIAGDLAICAAICGARKRVIRDGIKCRSQS